METIANPDSVLPSEALTEFVPPLLEDFSTPEEKQVVRYGINIGNVHLLIPEHGGSEVLLQPPVFSLPNTPAFFLGVSNIRGNIVPIYDFYTAFNLQRPSRDNSDDSGTEILERRSQSRQQRVLVMGTGDLCFGLVIEKLPSMIPILENTARIKDQHPLPDQLAKFVSGGYVVEKKNWHELDFISLVRELSGS